MPLTATIAPATSIPAAVSIASRSPGPAGAPRRRRRRGATLRPAVGAGVRLGVEAAVARVLVLGPAALAHLEAGHRRQRPVVGDAADDREARAAVGAVGERVAVAAVGGVEELGQAVGAGGEVRARPGPRGSPRRSTRAIRNSPSPRGAADSRRHGLDRRQRRRLGAAAARAARRPRRRRPRPRAPPRARRCSTQPPSAELGGEPEDEGPEADALDRAGRRARAPGGGRGSARRRQRRPHSSGAASSISSRSTW